MRVSELVTPLSLAEYICKVLPETQKLLTDGSAESALVKIAFVPCTSYVPLPMDSAWFTFIVHEQPVAVSQLHDAVDTPSPAFSTVSYSVQLDSV